MISNESCDKALAELKLGLSLAARVSFGISEVQRILACGYNRAFQLVEHGINSGELVILPDTTQFFMFKDSAYSAHVQMKVETALNMSVREIKSWWGDDVKAVRAELNRLKESGCVYLHTEGCDNEDPVTGKCLRHYVNKGDV